MIADWISRHDIHVRFTIEENRGGTYDSFLAKDQRILDEFAFWRKVEPIVELFGPVMRHELVAQATDFAVHDEGFGV